MLKSYLFAATAAMALTVSTLVPKQANAGGVPVFDSASLAQMVKQIVEMGKQLTEAQKQTEKLEDIIHDLTGSRDLSGLLNDTDAQTARRYADTDIHTFLDLASGKGSLSKNADGLSATAIEIISELGLRSGAEMIPSEPEGVRAHSIDLAHGTTIAAMSIGERSFNASTQRLSHVEELIGAIDNTQDLKASVDLNTRMQGQVALLLNEMLTLQAMQLRATGVEMGLNAAGDDNLVSTFSFNESQYRALNNQGEN